ncbi:MAG: hypothetical protein ABFS39_10290 [Pseudomonadota bacterium]
MLNTRLNILVALPCEAKPINQLLSLKRLQPDGDLPLYVGQDATLVLAGHGIEATATGVRVLHQRNSNKDACWLNIGIAGHAKLPVGRGMIASQVLGPGDGQSWNMIVPEHLNCPAGIVQTVLQPASDYPNQAAYEMEAAGFVAAALEFSPIAKIHVLKLISDNPDNPNRGISAKMVRTLIQAQSGLIRQLINRILREDVEPPSS